MGADGVQQEPGPAAGGGRRRFDEVLREAGEQELLSEEHFTVDGTLLEAWASQKSFQRKDAPEGPPPEDPGNWTSTGPTKHTSRRQTRTLRAELRRAVLMENRNGLVVNESGGPFRARSR